MTLLSSRWRQSSVATAVCFGLLMTGACSKGHAPAAAGTAATPPAVPVAGQPPAADSAAQAARTKALGLTKNVRSYAFQAVQQLSGAHPQTTRVLGRAARPSSVAYTLTLAQSRQEVVKIGSRSFLRVPPGPWKALAASTATADPLASLLTLLAGLEHPALAGRTLKGVVPARVLSAARLAPQGAAPGAVAPVAFVLDAQGRVTSVTLHLSVRAGTQSVRLDEVTTFSSFDHVAPIVAPAVVQH